MRAPNLRANLCRSGQRARPFKRAAACAQRADRHDQRHMSVAGAERCMVAPFCASAPRLGPSCAKRLIFYHVGWLLACGHAAPRGILLTPQRAHVHPCPLDGVHAGARELDVALTRFVAFLQLRNVRARPSSALGAGMQTLDLQWRCARPFAAVRPAAQAPNRRRACCASHSTPPTA